MILLGHKVSVLSCHSDDPVLDEMFAPLVTYYQDDEDFLKKFGELKSMPESQRAKLALDRLRYFRAMPRLAHYIQITNSTLMLDTPPY
jgi:hypothetical protein